MNKNEIKTILREYPLLISSVKELELQIEEAKLIGPTGISYEERVQGGDINSSSVTGPIVHLESLERKLELLKRKLQIAIDRIDNLFKGLSDLEQQCVRYKYINGNTVPEIADKIYKSDRQVGRYIANGLEKMQKILGGHYYDK